jgi:site-specific DNA recombinase
LGGARSNLRYAERAVFEESGKVRLPRVTEVKRNAKDRHFLRGEFGLKLRDLAHAAELPPGEPHEGDDAFRNVEIHFREPERYEELADEMKTYLDTGKSVDDVLANFGCSYTLFNKAMDHWHQVRGLKRPDGRSLRGRLQGRRASNKLQAEIMQLWQAEDLTVQQIADKLGCGLESIRKAVVDWHIERGMPVPDGRARRKAMRERKKGGSGHEAA